MATETMPAWFMQGSPAAEPMPDWFTQAQSPPAFQPQEPLVLDPTFGGRYVASQPSPEERALLVQAGNPDPLHLMTLPFLPPQGISLPTLPSDELATKVWKSSGKTWREMTDAERRQAVEMDTIDNAPDKATRDWLIRNSVARDQELQPEYKIDPAKIPPPPSGTPVPIPQQVLDATREQIQALPDGPEKDRLIQVHATVQQLSAQARADIAAANAKGLTYTQWLAAESPQMQAVSNLGGQNIGGDVARGVLLGLIGVGNTVSNVLLRGADKMRRKLAAGEDGTQPVGPGLFGDADAYVNQRNDALASARQVIAANQGQRRFVPASVTQNAAETLTTIGAMGSLGIPVIPGFAAQIADTTYSANRKKGMSEDKAAVHAVGTAALQSALMVMAGRVGKQLGLIPREELLSPAMAKAAQDVFTKEGVGAAAKNILFQGGEGAAIHVAQSAFDAATGARPDALEPENLWPETIKAGGEWALLGAVGTAGHASPEVVRKAWSRALTKLPGAMARANAAEQRLIDQLSAGNIAISRADLAAVGVSTRGRKPSEYNALAEQYIKDQLMPRAEQAARQQVTDQIPAAMMRFTTLNPQMPGGAESFVAGPNGVSESFTVDRSTVLPEVPNAERVGGEVESRSPAQGTQGPEGGGLRVRDAATSNQLEAGQKGEVSRFKRVAVDRNVNYQDIANRPVTLLSDAELDQLFLRAPDKPTRRNALKELRGRGLEIPQRGLPQQKRQFTSEPERGYLPPDDPQIDENLTAIHERLLRANAQLKSTSQSGSRYYELPDGSQVRVADHSPNEPTFQWMDRNGVEDIRTDARNAVARVDQLLGEGTIESPAAAGVERPADATVASTQPQEPSNGSQNEAGQVGQEVQQGNAESQVRQNEGQELLSSPPQVSSQAESPQPAPTPAVSTSAKDFVASLAKPKKGQEPAEPTPQQRDAQLRDFRVAARDYVAAKDAAERGKGSKSKERSARKKMNAAAEAIATITEEDFRRQVARTAIDPSEADAIISLFSDFAAYRGDSLGAFVAKAIAGVERVDKKYSAYLAKYSDAPPSDASNPNVLAQAAYHASPHRFDKFTTDNIGGGEGSQAFGWGLYFAGNKEVADYYHQLFDRRMNARTVPEVVIDGVRENAAIHKFEGSEYEDLQSLIYYVRLFGDSDYALNYAREHSKDPTFYDRHKIDILPREKGAAMYKVDLKPTDDELLQWDKPLAQQSEGVKQKLAAAGYVIKPSTYPSLKQAEDLFRSDRVQRDAASDVGVRSVLRDGWHLVQAGDVEGFRRWFDHHGAMLSPGRFHDMTGERLYELLQQQARLNDRQGTLQDSQRAASQLLQSFGIRGIKYADQKSRFAPPGQMNYRARWADNKTDVEVYDAKTGKAIDKQFKTFSEADEWIATQDDSENRTHNYVIFDGADAAIEEVLAQKDGNRVVRGETVHLNDGRAIVRAFRGAQNLATFAHETSHVFRRWLLPEDLRIAEQALGVKEGKKWTRDQEERFARHFERYLRDGESPTPKLATVFERFKTWLTNIYRNLAGGPLKDEIPPELRDVFDRMLGATDAQIAERRGGDASFDFGANELDAEAQKHLKDANKAFRKLQRGGEIGEEYQALWDEKSDADKAAMWRSASDFARDENDLRSLLKMEFNSLFGEYRSNPDVKSYITKSGKRIIRKDSPAARARARARMVERKAGDYTRIRGFDLAVSRLEDGTYSALAGEASARGNGNLSDGLFDILQGGAKQFDSVPTEEHLLNLLGQEYEYRQRSPEATAGEVRGVSEGGDVIPRGGDGSLPAEPEAGGQAAPAPEADFALSREGSPDASSIVEPYQPERASEARPAERQPLMEGMPEDMNPGTLAGQQGLFQETAAPAGLDFPTGIKNAVTAADRAAMGRPPRPPVEPESFNQWDQEALATLYRDPQAGQKIVDELLVNDRPLKEREVFVVLNHKTRLMNEQNEVGNKLADAYDAGDQQAINDLNSRFGTLSDQIHAANVAMEKTGTQQGRALVARKAMTNPDYSLAALESRMRGAFGGRPLTEAERVEIIRLNNRIQELEKKIAEGQRRTRNKAFEEASDRERKRAKTRKKDPWTPDDIEITPDSDRLDIANAVKQATRYFYGKGIEDREANIMAVHELLQPYLGEGWTLDNARDALSDYGTVRELNKDPYPTWLRQIRRQHQQVRKLIDMLAGRAPKITGTEREPPGDELRALTKTANNYKRFYNITSGNDASNARSALDAVKTRLNNEIRDLEQQIRKRAKIIKKKNDLQYDEEANRLKFRRDELKAQFDEIFGKPEMTDAKRMELAMKAMERNIADLDRRIKEGDFTSATPRSFDSPEYLALKAKQQTMRAEYENLREYDPQYAEQQRQKRLATVERQIADYEQQIATGTFPSPAARKAVDLDLQAAQEVRNALRQRRNDARKTNPLWMQEQQRKDLLRLQTRILKRAERLADRMGREDYASKTSERRNGPYDEQTTRAMEELDKLQREFDDKAYDANLKVTLEADIKNFKRQLATLKFDERLPREVKPLSPEARRLKTQRDILKQQVASKKAEQERGIIGRLWQKAGVLRMLQTTGEFSFMGRQGGKHAFASVGGLLVGDTKTAATYGRAVREAFKSFGAEKYAKASDERMFNSPNLDKWQEAGLRVIHEGEHISGNEEVLVAGMLPRLPEFIPGAKWLNQNNIDPSGVTERFNRSARVFFNELRTGAFDAMTVANSNLTPEQLKVLGTFVNISTGYGSLGELAPIAKVLSATFYSPRNLAANFQYVLEPLLLAKGNRAGVRLAIAKQYAKTLTGLVVAYGLAWLAGAEIGNDPRSSDFWKWKFGNTRIDPLMGLSQVFVLGGRVGSGKTVDATGKAKPIAGTDAIKRFLQQKLSPNAAIFAELIDRKTGMGESLSWTGQLQKAGPITWLDIYDAMKEQGVPAGSAMGLLSFFGLGLQTYQPKQHPTSRTNRRDSVRRSSSR